MNIFYTVDNNFVPQLAAGIASVCENNQREPQITFYVGSKGIMEENQKLLRQFVSDYHREIVFMDISNIRNLIGFDFDTTGWNDVVLARLLVDRLIPDQVDRVLFLDGDTIVRGSLHSLWQADLKGKVLAASLEPTVDKKRKENLGLENNYYYNAGVLLIDLKKWRENKTGEQILKYYRDHDGQLFANDQDAINGSQKGKIYTLPPKFNFFNIYWLYPYKMLRFLVYPMPYFSKKNYEHSVKNPIIIHYCGEERPWRRGNHHPYKRDYEYYLEKTPWKNTPQERGWEVYMQLFALFHMVLRPFPELRYRIINSLIPTFIRIRKKRLQKNSGDKV